MGDEFREAAQQFREMREEFRGVRREFREAKQQPRESNMNPTFHYTIEKRIRCSPHDKGREQILLF